MSIPIRLTYTATIDPLPAVNHAGASFTATEATWTLAVRDGYAVTTTTLFAEEPATNTNASEQIGLADWPEWPDEPGLPQPPTWFTQAARWVLLDAQDAADESDIDGGDAA